MDIKTVNATHAYAEALSRVANLGPPARPEENQAGPSFAELLSDTAKGAMTVVEKGEKTSIQSLSNDASVVDIVTAVTNAEIALETIVALRDRVVQAYQEILRMPI